MERTDKSKYSKIDEFFKYRLIASIYSLILYVVAQVFIISNLSEFPENYFIIIIIMEILFTSGLLLYFYYTFSLLKDRKFEINLKKNSLKFEKNLNIQANKLMKNIKIVEEKLSELEDMYSLLEKDNILKMELKNQKEKHQYQNYKLKLETLNDFLHEIKKNYEESLKFELKILWTTKPRILIRKIKRITKDINHINTQCYNIEIQLKEEFE